MERTLMQGGYHYSDIRNMDYTEFMCRYMVLKELLRSEQNG